MPRPARPCALVTVVATAALVASPASAAGGDADQPTQPRVRVTGTLLQTVKEPHTSGPRYAVRLTGGGIVALDTRFATAPAPNSRFRGVLEVPQPVQDSLARSGTRLADGSSVPASSRAGQRALALVARTGASMAVDQSTVSAPAAETSAPTTRHRIFVAVPDNLGHTTRTPDATILANLTKDADYWGEQANGRVADVVPSTVVHYRSSVPGAAGDCGLGDSFYPMLNEAEGLFPGFDEATDHLVIGIPEQDCAGDVLGLGTVGTGFGTGGGLVATLAAGDTLGAVAHEMGHNYGFLHANVRCGASCSKEYDGIYDVMGYGMGAGYNQLTALSTVYRLLDGVTDPGEVADVSPGTARTLTLVRRGSDSGVRSLAVRDPHDGSTYFVDLRTGQGRDARAAYAAGGSIDGYQFRTGVVVTQGYGRSDDGGPIGTGGVEVVPNGTRTAFRPGESWRSPSGTLVVRVDALSTESASVTVLRTIPQVATPRITGSSRVGRRLQLARGSWTPGTSLSQTWYVGGRAVSHAASLRLGRSARGKRVVVTVTGHKAGYADVTRASATTAPVRR